MFCKGQGDSCYPLDPLGVELGLLLVLLVVLASGNDGLTPNGKSSQAPASKLLSQ